MTALPPLEVGEFASFFHAVHSQTPFPWQERLSRQVSEKGWPGVLDLPTGTGKTAVLDVAVFNLALAAGGTPRASPLRIVYVVDRRTIVDQAHERATKIQRALKTPEHDVLRRVRERLTTYSSEGVPLRTALLRGGIARDDLWARTPDQPLIVLSTVDQAGSRLLFRGYGVSDEMKSVHAGLLGCDVLYLLDEVHLSYPFRETLTAIQGRYRNWAEHPLCTPFVVAEMSATPGDATADAFQLADEDRTHDVLSARLRSSKPASLVAANRRGFAKEIEKHVLSMLERPGATIAVVVNRVKSARELHERLAAASQDRAVDVELLTGRMRPFDRDAIEARLLRRIRAGRTRSPDDRAVVVVATQSIEAGADFDFDGLITECASLDALRQRFGRLDRFGQLAGSARAVIVARTDSLKDDPVYGNAIGATWDWLLSMSEAQSIDFGIEKLTVPPDAERRGLLAPKAYAPVLLPSHLDAWVQTAPIPNPDPDVALWLHGPDRGPADVQIVWRGDLTRDLLDLAGGDDREAAEAQDLALSMVDALPPVSAEAMTVPFLAAKRWLDGQPEPESFDVEGAKEEEEVGYEPQPEHPPRSAVRWQGENSAIITAKDLGPGQTVVVPSSYGGIAHGNWSPSTLTPVPDVAELATLRQGRRPVIRLHNSIVAGLFGPGTAPPIPLASESEPEDDGELVDEWLRARHASLSAGPLRDLLSGFAGGRRSLQVERLKKSPSVDSDQYFVVAGKRRPRQPDDEGGGDERSTTEGSTSSFTGTEVSLADHLAGVAKTATIFAERVGLSADIVADLRLAALWHDAGKADPRFQRWLHGGSEFRAIVQPAPLAKSATRLSDRAALRAARQRAGYPVRARHELMSLVLMTSAREAIATSAGDWALVQHLVAAHHGHCRPLAPWAADPAPVSVRFSHDGLDYHASSAHQLARLDSGIAEAFWELVRRYGWWGLAWLETLLRLSDHRQSEFEQDSGR
jgi:CRISPR-associated endonuclease/helicase Cas3